VSSDAVPQETDVSVLSFLIIRFTEVDPSSFSKKIPSVTPSIIVVSVMIKPIAKSDCVASLTLNLVLKYRPFAASYLKDSITPPDN